MFTFLEMFHGTFIRINYVNGDTNQNSIRKGIKTRLRSGKAYYLLVQNLLSSVFLTQTINMPLYRTIILSVVLYLVWNVFDHTQGGT